MHTYKHNNFAITYNYNDEIFSMTVVTPMIKVKMDNNTINLLVRNYNLTMRCLPSDTDLKYKWNRKNTSLPTSAVGVNTSTMTIYRLTPEDAGDYQCVLSNISGVISSQFSALKINGTYIHSYFIYLVKRRTFNSSTLDQCYNQFQIMV